MHPETDSDNLAAQDDRVDRAVRDLVARHGDTKVLRNEPLSNWTTLRIGGPAAALCRMRTPAEVVEFLNFAREHAISAFCLGGGSNVLVDDRGYCGLVIHLEDEVVRFEAGAARVGAGVPLDYLISRCLTEGRPGLEFASGIPGSVGGALVGNAGCFGREIGEFLLEATVLRADGRTETIGPEAFAFAYRTSRLKGGPDIVLDALIRAEPGPVEQAMRERKERIAERHAKHPITEASAGSYFKNLPPATPESRRRAAGVLLDQCGARGWREGDAAVYDKHANIIVNLGFASCANVLRLAERMRQAVQERFGVSLEPEVRYLARYPSATGFGVDTEAPKPDF